MRGSQEASPAGLTAKTPSGVPLAPVEVTEMLDPVKCASEALEEDFVRIGKGLCRIVLRVCKSAGLVIESPLVRLSDVVAARRRHGRLQVRRHLGPPSIGSE